MGQLGRLREGTYTIHPGAGFSPPPPQFVSNARNGTGRGAVSAYRDSLFGQLARYLWGAPGLAGHRRRRRLALPNSRDRTG